MDELSPLLLTMGSICAASLLGSSRMLSAEGEPIVSSGFPPVYGKPANPASQGASAAGAEVHEQSLGSLRLLSRGQETTLPPGRGGELYPAACAACS